MCVSPTEAAEGTSAAPARRNRLRGWMHAYARNHCVIFIALLALYLVIGFAGVRQLMQRDEAFEPACMHRDGSNLTQCVRVSLLDKVALQSCGRQQNPQRRSHSAHSSSLRIP